MSIFFKLIFGPGFILLLIIVAIKTYFQTRKGKGLLGELETNFGLALKLDPKKYKIVHDVTIKDERGKTQIDLIVVSESGLFVIENKNYRGLILADEKAKYWTQVLGKKKFKFYSPIRQNYRHVKALAKFLDVEEEKIRSIVYFSGDCTLRGSVPEHVLTKNVSKYIKKLENEKVFSSFEVEKIYEILKALKTKNWKE